MHSLHFKTFGSKEIPLRDTILIKLLEELAQYAEGDKVFFDYKDLMERQMSEIVPLVSIIDERHGISKIEHKIDSLMTRFINLLLEIALYHLRVPEPVLSPWEESIIDHTWYMRNSNWIDRQYAGKYIAIVKGNIVGSGDAGEAYEEAAKKGYQDPFLIYVVPRDIVFTVI